MINSAQIKAARAILGIDQKEFAELCKVSLPTIRRIEATKGPIRGNISTITKVLKGIEKAGVEIISENNESKGKGYGVRLK